MSTKDIKHEPDQEFEDFLLGQGDLASLLQSLPQPAPSAELDARILRDAEIALASKATANISDKHGANAANDPAAQPGQRPPANFFSRWRYPLGLAATLVLTMSVTLSVWRGQSLQETPSVLIAGEARRVNGPDTPAPAASTAAQPTSASPASPAAESAAAPAVVATPAASHPAVPAASPATAVATNRADASPAGVPPAAAPASRPQIAAIPQPMAEPPLAGRAAAGLPAPATSANSQPATSAKDGAVKEEAVKGAAQLADAKTGAAAPSAAAPVELAKSRDAKRDVATEPARLADELAQQPHKKAKRMAMDNSPVLAEAASQEKAQAPASSQIQARGQVLALSQENKQMAREDDYANRQASEALAQSRMQQAQHNRAQQMPDKSQNRSQEQTLNRAQEQTLNRAQNQSQESRAMAARAHARAEADMADSAPAQVAAAPARTYASPPPPPAAAEARPAPANALPGVNTNGVSRAEPETVRITGAVHAPAKPAAPKETPQAWFERIEKFLKDGKRKEALDEWQKFQATHPAFVVPAATLMELEALRGQK